MRAIIYARVSSTTDRQTTDRQVEDLKSYAEYSKMEVVKVFEEKIGKWGKEEYGASNSR